MGIALAWHMTAAPVSPPPIPVLAERGGTQLKTPRGVVIVDTREKCPFDFSRFTGWFAGVEKTALALGDYTIAGLEDTCAIERKDLSDLVHSFTVERSVFVDRLRRMHSFPHRLLVITTTQPNKVSVSAFRCGSESDSAVAGRCSRRTRCPLRDDGNARTWGGDRGLVSLPDSSL
jgi:hypothetical protein